MITHESELSMLYNLKTKYQKLMEKINSDFFHLRVDFEIKFIALDDNPKQILLCINAAVKTFYYHQSTSKLQILTCIAVVGSSVLKYLICYISSYFFPL